MKIFRITYEEIDTEDRDNVLENVRMTSQLAVSPFELSMCKTKQQREQYIDLTKRTVWEELRQRVF